VKPAFGASRDEFEVYRRNGTVERERREREKERERVEEDRKRGRRKER
jgi:hypothetical protein